MPKGTDGGRRHPPSDTRERGATGDRDGQNAEHWSPWSAGPTRAERRRAERAREKSRRRDGVPGWVWWLMGGAASLALIVLIAVLTRPSMPSRGDPPSGVRTFDEPNRTHVDGTVTYDRTPPAGGNHAPVWLNCGIYGQPVPNENAVHSLEHGAVWITYQPSLPAADVQSLRTLVASRYEGLQRYVILSPYPRLPAPVVATAWGHQLSLQSADDPRIAQFIDYYREGPQDLEPGAACSGGLGRPIG